MLCYRPGMASPSSDVLHVSPRPVDRLALPLGRAARCVAVPSLRPRVPLPRQVAQSIEDHHQEVIGFCRENGFHGLVAYDSDYALCNIPYYFSAHALKLSRNGKSLTTSQYLMHEVAKQLDLNPNRFPIFAALLGRWAARDGPGSALTAGLRAGPHLPFQRARARVADALGAQPGFGRR